MLDLWLAWLNRYPESIEGRWAAGLTALAALTWLSDGDLPTLGLVPPAGGWRRWAGLAALLGVVAAACMGAAAGLWVAAGWRLPVQAVAPSQVGPALLRMCVFAPLLEESLYRVALCVPLARAVGPWAAVTASAAAFGLLHVAYGHPSPENLLGGFFLAWAYLRSGSVFVPVALHAIGNLLILIGQVGVWYWAEALASP
ncbi:CPBP family intramembrane glutamic endopeptidase [Tautonia plasticadhaerens]|uniref:CPBP family intramembrane glutamic endopeptidase n=1 Tax=Tautonia plasticadhaerens TaxID=2527974 RepID=UPI0018D26B94|nr:CPBP family intramembrane glutamic endopeptidase [Tautonia plasticadhaerens]